ncbi:hypothetical protein K431DRAFT_291667 [Polychaeton citri CBS 116435]|uniref:Uncharacterized protein n=1 Tax=Polychaeton citri CBS 116435 TaxID=1314669 RepID=A0A9P4QGP7_9PEZI|nr:hypothetical protein K431DRAFT_291667 [Polychaeton citri CBS 116435]
MACSAHCSHSRQYMDDSVYRSAQDASQPYMHDRLGLQSPGRGRDDYFAFDSDDSYDEIYDAGPSRRRKYSGRAPRDRRDVHELVRRTNLQVASVNNHLSHLTPNAQLHPMMCSDGSFPYSFRSPMGLQQLASLPTYDIDRILNEYGLPRQSGRYDASDDYDSSRRKGAKILMLLEFLGSLRLAESLRRSRRRDAVEIDGQYYRSSSRRALDY